MDRSLHLLPGARPARSHRSPDRLTSVFLAIVALVVLAALVSSMGAERRALRRLPESERRAVLARTVDELNQVCGEDHPPALATHCRQLASFAAQFDECRGGCEALVRRELAAHPTR